MSRVALGALFSQKEDDMRTFVSVVTLVAVVCFGVPPPPEKIGPPKDTGPVPAPAPKEEEERSTEYTFAGVQFEVRGDFAKVISKGDQVEIVPLKRGGKITLLLWNKRDHHRKVVLIISEGVGEGKPPDVVTKVVTLPPSEEGKWVRGGPIVIGVQPGTPLKIVLQGIGLDEL